MARQKAGSGQIRSDSVVEFTKPNQSFDGYFLGSNNFQGNYGPSTAHMFLGQDGKTHCVYGTKVLNDLMSEVAKGTHTWVIYKGKKKTKNGNLAKIWDVEFDTDDVLDEAALSAATVAAESEDSEEEDSDMIDTDDAVPADEVPVAKATRAPVAKATASSADKLNNLLKNRRAAQ